MTEQKFNVSYIGYRPNTNLDDTIEELEKVGATYVFRKTELGWKIAGNRGA